MLNRRMRRQMQLQSGLFVVLLLAAMGLLAWLSQLNPLVIDLTSNQRNSLSQETIRLVKSLQKPLQITVFVTPLNENRGALEQLFQRYVKAQPHISFSILNPDLRPDLLREHNIRFDGETLLEYQGRSEKISQVTETKVTNSIQRLMRQGERWLVFLQGHAEPDPYGEANHDLGLFATQLTAKGYTIENLLLTQTNSIPDNTDVLVIASPRVSLLPGEVVLIEAFLARGGNLLWLADPEQSTDEIGFISDLLTLEFLPGIIVDPNSQLLGLNRVDFTLVSEYPRHPITLGLDSLSLFPQAQAIEFYADSGIWERRSFLLSSESSWNETGAMSGDIYGGDNDDEFNGPFNVGVSLVARRQTDDGAAVEQRIVVIGDADFLSNRYLGNGGNLELGLNLFNWLSHDDNLIAISPRAAPDTVLELSQTQQIIIGFGFLLVMPLALFGTGLFIWLRRRKR